MNYTASTIEIYDKNEKLIYSFEKQENQAGRNSHVVSNEVFKNTKDLEFLYVLVRNGEQTETKRILFQ